MPYIKCTKKLQGEMGLNKADLSLTSSTDLQNPILGSWHANLIYIDRKKCVLFVNDKTLFNFIVADIPRKRIKILSKLFKDYLKCVLAEEGLADQIITDIMAEYDQVGYANTDDKRVLGSMNDLAFHYKLHIQSQGGVHSYAVPEIIKKLNRMPMGTLKYGYPIEALKALYRNAMALVRER